MRLTGNPICAAGPLRVASMVRRETFSSLQFESSMRACSCICNIQLDAKALNIELDQLQLLLLDMIRKELKEPLLIMLMTGNEPAALLRWLSHTSHRKVYPTSAGMPQPACPGHCQRCLSSQQTRLVKAVCSCLSRVICTHNTLDHCCIAACMCKS